MPVFEVVSGGDRRSLIKRFMRKGKAQAVSELIDLHLLHCTRIENLEQQVKELENALARVADLEKQVAVAWGAFHFGGERDGKLYTHSETEAQIEAYILDMHRSSDSLTLRKGPLYAGPVAQAQQLHDLDKQCRDDVARALGLRPNQERGFAWSYLLASIKSCVKASEDSAQAQHSVPGDIMRDAQRYRWLRDQQFYFSFSTENSDAGISSCTAGMSSRFKNLSWVDAAIDSAIAAAPGKEGV
ncbi:TPA: hypothetical protein R7370_000247 [Pseudomonas aeruginosa]|nr:hypothetical protein [Pseudomonas aeruginosa]